MNETEVDLVITGDVVTFSTSPGYHDGQVIWEPAFDHSFLLGLDPVAIKVVLVFGGEEKETLRRNIRYITTLSDQLRDTDISLVVEPVMWGPRVPERFETDPEYVANGSRMAWEFGADILKIPYTGSSNTFEQIVRNSPVPAMILGVLLRAPSRHSLQTSRMV